MLLDRLLQHWVHTQSGYLFSLGYLVITKDCTCRPYIIIPNKINYRKIEWRQKRWIILTVPVIKYCFFVLPVAIKCRLEHL